MGQNVQWSEDLNLVRMNKGKSEESEPIKMKRMNDIVSDKPYEVSEKYQAVSSAEMKLNDDLSNDVEKTESLSLVKDNNDNILGPFFF